MTLTPKERAEKVYCTEIDGMLDGMCDLEDKKEICAAIAAAIDEAYKDGRKSVDVEHEWNLGRLSGFTEGVERAAKMMEENLGNLWDHGVNEGARCSSEIRSLLPAPL